VTDRDPDKKAPEPGTKEFQEPREKQGGQETRPNAPEIVKVTVPKPPPPPKKSE
jgi:hypothetical protein